MNTRISCIAYQQSRLDSFAPSPSPKLTDESFSSGDDVDGTDGSSSSSDDEMMSSHWCTFCHLWQKGGVVLYMRVVIMLGGELA